MTSQTASKIVTPESGLSVSCRGGPVVGAVSEPSERSAPVALAEPTSNRKGNTP
jgi:hypothetical protein